jgi:hypothetical protein
LISLREQRLEERRVPVLRLGVKQVESAALEAPAGPTHAVLLSGALLEELY